MAKARTDELREKVTKIADDAKERFDDVSAEVRKGAERATKEIRQGYEKASTAAREGYEDASKRLQKGYNRVRKDFDSLSSDMNDYVRDNPGRSILLAAGVGFLLGLLFRGGGDRE
ncbi:MAG: hypothetical protein PVG07_11195 [Acidobacteriota bacterium]